ncbi:hypothetical protein SADUNF_Sadunf06G0142700 [Salix dunnii]|uniref:Uncharacterized protein n=1 Tax=Salix dunnii TaxID=1413687 RepID=A0A835K787_9ROSI|nr:hypothetical protein SADUNF_Sadunf06G0142700 [Salix dunnii]
MEGYAVGQCNMTANKGVPEEENAKTELGRCLDSKRRLKSRKMITGLIGVMSSKEEVAMISAAPGLTRAIMDCGGDIIEGLNNISSSN